jgi:hypothetical protein
MPIVLARTCLFLNRRGRTNLQDEYSNNREFADFLEGSPEITYLRSYNWEEHFDPASPIRRDNAYLKSCSKRKRKYWVLQRNGTFKFKITPDRHNAGQKLIYCLLPDPPHFSLPSTFKWSICGVHIKEWYTVRYCKGANMMWTPWCLDYDWFWFNLQIKLAHFGSKPLVDFSTYNTQILCLTDAIITHTARSTTILYF